MGFSAPRSPGYRDQIPSSALRPENALRNSDQTLGHTPSTAGTFRKKFRKNSGKTPETLSERFLEFPSRVRLGCPKPFNSRHLRLPEHFQNYLPPVRLGALLFSEVVPERASQSRTWNSQQYWGHFWNFLRNHNFYSGFVFFRAFFFGKPQKHEKTILQRVLLSEVVFEGGIFVQIPLFFV